MSIINNAVISSFSTATRAAPTISSNYAQFYARKMIIDSSGGVKKKLCKESRRACRALK